ncbi:MAG: type II toxin-antitoxin system PemK/MazF family toxin [Chloroflexi bacterium]|nr:type II toxin-antitoxin system PemK/MazF family toxin [Chloroflexota bacterium]
MEIKQGDVYWVELEAPLDSEPGYRRPCIVIQNNVFNQSSIKTVVVCMLTSNLDRANLPGNVLLETRQGGVKKTSVVNITQIFTMDKNDLDEYIGSITQQKMKQIISGINLLLQPMEIIQE